MDHVPSGYVAIPNPRTNGCSETPGTRPIPWSQYFLPAPTVRAGWPPFDVWRRQLKIRRIARVLADDFANTTILSPSVMAMAVGGVAYPTIDEQLWAARRQGRTARLREMQMQAQVTGVPFVVYGPDGATTYHPDGTTTFARRDQALRGMSPTFVEIDGRRVE